MAFGLYGAPFVAFTSTIPSSFLNFVRAALNEAVDGGAGGTYTPTEKIIFRGHGVDADPFSGIIEGTGTGTASTTVAVGSNGVNTSTFTGSGVLHVGSTTGFPSSGILWINGGTGCYAIVGYTGITSNTFTGCTRGAGYGSLTTGDSVTYGTNLWVTSGAALVNSGTALIASGGILVVASGAFAQFNGGSGTTFASGSLTLFAAGSTLGVAGAFNLAGPMDVLAAGSITMESGATLEAKSGSTITVDAGGTLTTAQPAYNANPGANNITVTGVVKCWANVTLSAGPGAVVNDGLNISGTVTFPSFGSTQGFKFSFIQPMASTAYSVTVNTTATASGGAGGDPQWFTAFVVAQTTTDFTIVFADVWARTYGPPAFADIIVCGRQ
jgi:hypothetical protein